MMAFFLLSGLAFAQEDSITITTYYPSPYGSYRDLDTQTIMHRPQTRSNIEGRFHCTDGAVPNTACTGLLYFDSGSDYAGETVSPGMYFFDGTNWNQLGESVIDEDSFDIGGYKKDNVHNSNYIVGSKSSDANRRITAYLTNATLIDLSDTASAGGKSANQIYGRPASGRVALSNASGQTDAAVRINFRNFPTGNYKFSWDADVDLDQYLNITGVRRTSPAPQDLNPITHADEYQEVVETALEKIRNTSISSRIYLQYSGSGTTWRDLDYSEYLYDSNEDNNDSLDQSANNWSIADNYTSYQITRAPMVVYSSKKYTKKDIFRYYRLIFKKGSGKVTSSSISIKLSSGDTDYETGAILTKTKRYRYRVYYDIPLKARVRNAKLIISRVNE